MADWNWHIYTAATAKSLQLCPTLCDPRDGSPPGSAIPGILQARTLEWVAISFSNAWKRKVKVKLLSHVQHLVTPWTAAYQAPRPWDFPGKSTGVGCHFLLQGIFLIQGSNPGFLHCGQILYCLSHQSEHGCRGPPKVEVQRDGVSLDRKTTFQQRQKGCFRSSQKLGWMVNKKRKEPCFSLKLDSQRFSCKGAIKCELWVFDEN